MLEFINLTQIFSLPGGGLKMGDSLLSLFFGKQYEFGLSGEKYFIAAISVCKLRGPGGHMFIYSGQDISKGFTGSPGLTTWLPWLALNF